MTFMIKDYIIGDTAVSYDDGTRCRDDMIKCFEDNEKIILDFSDINYAITAFLNPIIGDLILKYGPDIMKKIGIANANNMIIKKIKLVRDGALLKREDYEE